MKRADVFCLASLVLANLVSAGRAHAIPPVASVRPLPVKVSAARASYGSPNALEALLERGEPFRTGSGESFLKISMEFEPALRATKVVIESCEADFHDGIEIALAPGMTKHYAESGRSAVSVSFDGAEPEIRSLAINFRHNEAVCLKAIRFFDAKGERVPIDVELSPVAAAKTPARTREKLKASFERAGIDDVLDRELIARSEEDNWVIRFRGDGTYFVFGRSEDLKISGRFAALGEFDVIEASKNKLKLSLKGRRWMAMQAWDGWYCGSACAGRDLASPAHVDETVLLERLSGSSYMVRNRNAPGRRSLPFSDASVRSSTLHD